MYKSVSSIVSALCSLLILVCRIEDTSAFANIYSSRASTIRWSSHCKPTIIRQLKASETAATDEVKDVVDAIGDDVEKPVIAEDVPQQQTPQAATTAKDVRTPPSQNTRGKIFKIQQPQDLLDFVIEDERLSIVKVYASWCKTCKVFDVRYRKLANQFGDLQSGPVRFAEMQYDNPNNEEMCKLLNATKLPYMLLYRGSKGKVADFQCTPAKFQMLIDTVNDLLSDDGTGAVNSIGTNSTEVTVNVTTPSSLDLQQQPSPELNDSADEVTRLREQLQLMEKEKIEMFELMKAQIEVDKEEIAKMVNVIKIQKTMIEERDEQIQKLSGDVEATNRELAVMTKNLHQQEMENKLMEQEVAISKSQVSEMTNRTAEAEKTIAALELKASIREREAKEKERQTKALWESWEKQKEMYEEERSSVRKMTALSVQTIKTKVRLFVSRK